MQPKRSQECAKHRKRAGFLTVSEYVDEHYWPIASIRLEATSLDTYEKEIRLRIRPSIGDVLLSDLTRKDIQGMLDCCATESVARKALGTLKTILNEAVGDGFMDAKGLRRYHTSEVFHNGMAHKIPFAQVRDAGIGVRFSAPPPAIQRMTCAFNRFRCAMCRHMRHMYGTSTKSS